MFLGYCAGPMSEHENEAKTMSLRLDFGREWLQIPLMGPRLCAQCLDTVFVFSELDREADWHCFAVTWIK